MLESEALAAFVAAVGCGLGRTGGRVKSVVAARWRGRNGDLGWFGSGREVR